MVQEYFDVVIVGAGLSGIGAACHLREKCPRKSFVILESRDSIGGTWDLFRYPGIRSDSDMHTLGYSFKPWRESKAIADGPSILAYIRETAAEYGVDKHIRYLKRVIGATWSSSNAQWTIETRSDATHESQSFCCNLILMCAGYFNYERGYTPRFKGRERFPGPIVHPQLWPGNLDYRNKKVVVIGSGATAMTLVPQLARQASQVVMLQRSPTYVISRPDRDLLANALQRILPQKLACAITRWKNITLQQWLYRRTRSAPDKVKRQLLKRVRKELGDSYDIDTHFTPSYNPWDQRLCLVPNSDLFHVIRSGKAAVVTDEIETFTESGILLRSGTELDADIIITATGLDLVALGGVRLVVDGQSVDVSKTYTYKGVMCSDVPNLVSTFGYINASWTLRADLIARFFCRIVCYMDAHGFRQCVPRVPVEDRQMPRRPWISGFSSGYMQRVMPLLPSQGDREPWLNRQDYVSDRQRFLEAPLADGALQFSDPAEPASSQLAALTPRTM